MAKDDAAGGPRPWKGSTSADKKISGKPLGIAADHSGNLWFTNLVSGTIGELDISGSTTTTNVPQVSLSVSSLSPSFGRSEMLSASVTSPLGVPTGNVTFFDGATALGIVILDANGHATLTLSLGVGTHQLTAHYAGNATFAAANSGTIQLLVSPVTTATTLQASVNPVQVGQNVTFKATVGNTLSAGTATGSVTFLDGGTPPATVQLNSSGQALLTTEFASAGSHLIEANFNGSTNFSGNHDTLVEQVNGATSPAGSITTLSASALTAKATWIPNSTTAENPATFWQP
jgi:hypothetical protein